MGSHKLRYVQYQGQGIKIVPSRKVQCMPGAVTYKLNSLLVLLSLMFLESVVTLQRTVMLKGIIS